MTAHCQGLGVEGDTSCGQEAVVVIRLKFKDQTFPWAPVCAIHGLDVMHNMAMAMAAEDKRYDFDWLPIEKMPDVEERHIVDPQFTAAAQADTPPQPEEGQVIAEALGGRILADMIRKVRSQLN